MGMKTKKLNQAGMTHILVVVLVVIVIAAIGFVGYRVMNASKATKTTATASTDTATSTEKTKAKTLAWKEGGLVVPGTYADADVIKISDTQWRMYYGTQPEVQGNQLQVYSSTSTECRKPCFR
jgi:hypothetical protein